LQVELSDRTGSISARKWNVNEADCRDFEDGDFVRVEGSTQLFQGAVQLIATNIFMARAEEVNEDDFLAVPSGELERMATRLQEHLRALGNPHLRNLADCYLLDEDLMRRFSQAPAGVKLHHAYTGGLLEHVLNLMDVVAKIVGCYPALDPDLLMMGAFLHDIGKTDELSYDRPFNYAYTDEGQLVGHLVMAVSQLEEKIRESERLSGEAFPNELALRLKHMIVSHHGEYDYGSPKLPMTLEAVALHFLDSLDAKLHGFEQLMRDDPNVESPWTPYHANIGRKLYKGTRPRRIEGESSGEAT